MRVKKIRNRGAQGSNRAGLKIGKRTIRSLSNEEVSTILFRIKKNVLQSRNNKALAGNKKHYKNLKRLIRLIRKTDKDGNLLSKPKPIFDFDYKECHWSDAIYPDRQKKWLKGNKRKEGERIGLKNFSFIDNPIRTYELLQKIVKAEAQTKSSHINFLDNRCLDIAPYLVLGLMRNNTARGVFVGGMISGSIYDVIDAVNLSDSYNLYVANKKTPDTEVHPFKMRSRRKPKPNSESDNPPADKLPHTTEEKTSNQFVITFDDWLKEIDPLLELTKEAQKDIGILFGELLDNAKRHSDPDSIDGQWHVAGFMEVLKNNDNVSNPSDEKKYVCHFSIISPGRSIYESMQEATEDTKKRILKYINNYWSLGHGQNKTEAYWNLCAMQDGISRIPRTEITGKNGTGFTESLVSLINAFGKSDDNNLKPAMTVISGQSCIRVKHPYDCYTTDKNGNKILAFNDDNDLKKPHHDDYVHSMPGHFPGTLITVRFVMDSNHLNKMAH